MNLENRKKFPPYARSLFERQKFKNLPLLVVDCIGQNCWNRAKSWNKTQNDIIGLVLPPGEKPDRYYWPVAHCDCVIEWDHGPSAAQILDLASEILKAGAQSVTVRPLFIDIDQPIYEYDDQQPEGDRWVQNREYIRTYHNQSNGCFQNVA